MAAVSANKLELLQIADAVAREKSIDRGIVIAAMEDAIARAARSRYGSETEVRAEIDQKKGELRLSRHMLVVEQVENPSNQISLETIRILIFVDQNVFVALVEPSPQFRILTQHHCDVQQQIVEIDSPALH